MRRNQALVFSCSILSLSVACTWSGDRTVPGALTGAGGNGGSHINMGRGGNAGTGVQVDSGTNIPTPDANCGQSTYGATALPPDLLILLDRSLSMNQDPSTGKNCTAAGCSKWDQVTAAINTVVSQTDTTIRWGLKFFGNDNQCGITAGAAVPIAANNAANIASAIAGTNPGSYTPTTKAELSAGDYLATLTDPNPKFVVLATDGLPTCLNNMTNMSSDATAAEAAVTTVAARGFQTFVIGIKTAGDTTADATLTLMSTNGGRPKAGTPNYYVVTSTPDLVTALGSIGMAVTSCTFTLSGTPPDPTNIAVLADGKKVPQDTGHTEGWDYLPGMTSIQLYGTACQNVLDMTTKDVQTIFGCPGVTIIVP